MSEKPEWRCAGCRHFMPLDDNLHWRLAEFFGGWCALAEMSDSTEENAAKRAVSQDASDYRASLLVKADFGCVEFVSLPPENPQ